MRLCISVSVSTHRSCDVWEPVENRRENVFQTLSYLKGHLRESLGFKRLEEKQERDGFTYHKLQFSLYVCPVKNLFPFRSQVPERRQRGAT